MRNQLITTMAKEIKRNLERNVDVSDHIAVFADLLEEEGFTEEAEIVRTEDKASILWVLVALFQKRVVPKHVEITMEGEENAYYTVTMADGSTLKFESEGNALLPSQEGLIDYTQSSKDEEKIAIKQKFVLQGGEMNGQEFREHLLDLWTVSAQEFERLTGSEYNYNEGFHTVVYDFKSEKFQDAWFENS